MELEKIRVQIDEIDDALVRLFVRRMELSAQVADYKKANSMPIYVPAREQEILKAISEKAGSELSEYACSLYAKIFELSRSYQDKRNASE